MFFFWSWPYKKRVNISFKALKKAQKTTKRNIFRRLMWAGLSVTDVGLFCVWERENLGPYCVLLLALPRQSELVTNWTDVEERVRGSQARRDTEVGTISWWSLPFFFFFSSAPLLTPLSFSPLHLRVFIGFQPGLSIGWLAAGNHIQRFGTILRTFYPNPAPLKFPEENGEEQSRGLRGRQTKYCGVSGASTWAHFSAICPPHSFAGCNGNSFV